VPKGAEKIITLLRIQRFDRLEHFIQAGYCFKNKDEEEEIGWCWGAKNAPNRPPIALASGHP